MNIKVTKVPSLIGDFLGCLPALQKLSERGRVYIDAQSNLKELIPKYYNIGSLSEQATFDKELEVDISEAFNRASRNNWYMSQAFMDVLGLEVPAVPPKADLDWGDLNAFEPNPFYIISPFARSLPPEDKWNKENWKQLAIKNPDKTFIVLGNSKYDAFDYIDVANVYDFFDRPLTEVCKLMKKSLGVLSVVTGTSHLAFHLGVKNIVLNNQDTTWGRNPDGIHIMTKIKDLKVSEVNKHINNA